METKYSLGLIPILVKGIFVFSFWVRKAQSYLGCLSLCVLPALQHVALWLGNSHSLCLTLSTL